jgi:hypothetical protein
MNLRRLLILSLLLNLALAVAWIFPRRETSAPSPAAVPSAEDSAPAVAAMMPPAKPASPTVVSNALFNWSAIESDDYRRYIANLRAADCPERTLRDIVVADIDELYAAQKRIPPATPLLWQNADHRRKAGLAQKAKESAVADEERALIKELIGYEWENHAEEMWEGDFGLAKFLGFLPDTKSLQLTALVGKYAGQAEAVKVAANHILIDEDRVELRKLYDGLVAEVSQLLTPAERAELELRIQAKGFLAEGDGIRWDGVTITTGLLREFVRLSKGCKDTWQNEFLSVREPPPEEQARRKAEFEKQVEKLFGPAHYAEYRRAQDPDFRETWAFMQEQNQSLDAAIKVYGVRRATEEQAGKLKDDKSLSAEERTAALAVLKSASAGRISSALGETAPEYLEYRAQWLENLAASPEPKVQNPAP